MKTWSDSMVVRRNRCCGHAERRVHALLEGFGALVDLEIGLWTRYGMPMVPISKHTDCPFIISKQMDLQTRLDFEKDNSSITCVNTNGTFARVGMDVGTEDYTHCCGRKRQTRK